jgi:hypothetical protein
MQMFAGGVCISEVAKAFANRQIFSVPFTTDPPTMPRKLLPTAILLLLYFAVPAQTLYTLLPDDTVSSKWINAAINLECVSALDPATPVENKGGTAIFLQYHGFHYLVTARHIIIDRRTQDDMYSHIALIENRFRPKNRLRNAQIDSSNDNVYLGPGSDIIILQRWGIVDSAAHTYTPYEVSDANTDVGIYCLELGMTGRAFLATLNKRHYFPISIKDIDTTETYKPGSKIYALGFPEESFVHKDSSYSHFWEAPIQSVLLMTQGRVELAWPGRPFFSGNVFVGHGFSGGPILFNNKLVGITSRGSAVIVRKDDYGMAISVLVKSKEIIKILRILDQRATKAFAAGAKVMN